jgi:hypothetical protein
MELHTTTRHPARRKYRAQRERIAWAAAKHSGPKADAPEASQELVAVAAPAQKGESLQSAGVPRSQSPQVTQDKVRRTNFGQRISQKRAIRLHSTGGLQALLTPRGETISRTIGVPVLSSVSVTKS